MVHKFLHRHLFGTFFASAVYALDLIRKTYDVTDAVDPSPINPKGLVKGMAISLAFDIVEHWVVDEGAGVEIRNELDVHYIPQPTYQNYYKRDGFGRIDTSRPEECDPNDPNQEVYRFVRAEVEEVPMPRFSYPAEGDYKWAHRRTMGHIKLVYDKFICTCKSTSCGGMWNCVPQGQTTITWKSWDYEWAQKRWTHEP